MAGVLESLARGLRQAGGVLSPDVQKQLAGEDAQDNAERRQVEMLRLQQRLQQETPEYQARMEALKNEKLFREAVAGAGGDMAKVAGAAVQYGKPELAVNLFNQTEQRASRLQEAERNHAARITEAENKHRETMARITDARQRDAETARHNREIEDAKRRGELLQSEVIRGQQDLKKLQFTMQGDRELVRRTQQLQGALEKANLPEADAVLGAVEDTLAKTPQVAEYISGPKSLLPDLALSKEITQGRQAFQKLFNITLKNRSGAAVTIPEFERLKKEFATGVWKKPEQLAEGVKQAREIISRHYASVSAGFGKDALEAYNENIRGFGGRVVLDAGKPSGAGNAEDPLGIR
jgi:hypothetical protein